MFKNTLKTFILLVGLASSFVLVLRSARRQISASRRSPTGPVGLVAVRARRLVGDPDTQASALAKLDRDARAVPMAVAPAQVSAYVANPLTDCDVEFSDLLLIHPPTEAPVAALLDCDPALAGL